MTSGNSYFELRANGRSRPRRAAGRRFDEQQSLLILLNLALPPVGRRHLADGVDAGRQALLDEHLRQGSCASSSLPQVVKTSNASSLIATYHER